MNETTNDINVETTPEATAVTSSTAAHGNKYELALIIKASLDDEAKNAQIEQITQLLGRFDATIEKVDEWGRRRLAYEIAKQNEGFYFFITFSAESSVPAEIESRVRIMESILRYLIIRIEE